MRLREEEMTMTIILIRHHGYPFINNENAVLVATGITHHIALIK